MEGYILLFLIVVVCAAIVAVLWPHPRTECQHPGAEERAPTVSVDVAADEPEPAPQPELEPVVEDESERECSVVLYPPKCEPRVFMHVVDWQTPHFASTPKGKFGYESDEMEFEQADGTEVTTNVPYIIMSVETRADEGAAQREK